MTRCRHEKLEVPYSGPYHHEVLFCTCVEISEEFSRNCSHVFLSRGSKSDPMIRFTLVARAGDLFRTIRLDDTVLRTLPMIARDEAKAESTTDEWLEVTQWNQFWKMLRRHKKGNCHDKWELKVPARYTIEQLDVS